MMMIDKGGGVVGDDMGEGMQCIDHPYRNNPGGICAFCLQEKLGKLVSSSKYNPSFPIPPSSSSSSPSEVGLGLGLGSNGTFSITSSSNNNNCHHPNRTRIPYLLAQKKTRKMVASSNVNLALERSKSTATPRRGHFLDADVDDYSPRKRGFWSFLHLSARRSSRDRDRDAKPSIHPTTATATATATATTSTSRTAKDKGAESSSSRRGDYADENESPNSSHASSSSFGRKVARSRSVGCGSRSFSGDFLERISTGFGDCTLRRVESQREAKPKVVLHRGSGGADDRIKERVKCGGIFGAFSMTSSSSSSYWLSSSAEDMNGRAVDAAAAAGALVHGRSKSWGWAFASPMRAFTRPSSKPDAKDGKRHAIQQPSNNNTTPNLAAIPSLLAVRG